MTIHEAGRELNAMVAEKVMGTTAPEGDIYSKRLGPEGQGDETFYWGIRTVVGTRERSWYYRGPEYSTSIAAAEDVVDVVTKPGGVRFTLRGSASSGNWRATFTDHRVVPNTQRSGEGNTIALAIALASIAKHGPTPPGDTA